MDVGFGYRVWLGCFRELDSYHHGMVSWFKLVSLGSKSLQSSVTQLCAQPQAELGAAWPRVSGHLEAWMLVHMLHMSQNEESCRDLWPRAVA